MSALVRLNHNNIVPKIFVNALRNARRISTSPNNRETVCGDKTETVCEAIQRKKTETKSKNWVSYGFSYKDEETDRNTTKSSFFFSITLCIVWGTFIWAYLPDTQMRDWAQRQGYLELRRREKAGVALVSPDYVDPDSIELPSDDELGDTQIII